MAGVGTSLRKISRGTAQLLRQSSSVPPLARSSTSGQTEGSSRLRKTGRSGEAEERAEASLRGLGEAGREAGPPRFYPRWAHTAVLAHGEGSPAARTGRREGPRRNRGRRTGAGGGRTTMGDPASVQGRPLPLPVRSALPPASLPRLPRGAAALHKHGPATGAGAFRSQPDGGACPAAGRGAAAGSAAAARLRRQTGREAPAGSSGGLRAPPRAAALP